MLALTSSCWAPAALITVQRRGRAGSSHGRDRDRGRFGYAAPSWIALILVGGSILLGLTACLRDRGDHIRAWAGVRGHANGVRLGSAGARVGSSAAAEVRWCRWRRCGRWRAGAHQLITDRLGLQTRSGVKLDQVDSTCGSAMLGGVATGPKSAETGPSTGPPTAGASVHAVSAAAWRSGSAPASTPGNARCAVSPRPVLAAGPGHVAVGGGGADGGSRRGGPIAGYGVNDPVERDVAATLDAGDRHARRGASGAPAHRHVHAAALLPGARARRRRRLGVYEPTSGEVRLLHSTRSAAVRSTTSWATTVRTMYFRLSGACGAIVGAERSLRSDRRAAANCRRDGGR